MAASAPAELPSVEDLKTVPLRAILALTSRCAKRVIGRYGVSPDHKNAEDCRQAVRQAVQLALDFAAGAEIDAAEAARVEVAVVQSVLAARQLGDANPAGAFAANSAYAAVNAANLARQSTAQDNPRALAEKAAQVAKTACDAAVSCDRTIRGAVLRDWEAIKQLDIGRYPKLGDPVNPELFGPLGPLFHDKRVLEELGGVVSQLAAQRDELRRMRVEFEIQQSRGSAEQEKLRDEREEFESQRNGFEEQRLEVEQERTRLDRAMRDFDDRQRDLEREREKLNDSQRRIDEDRRRTDKDRESLTRERAELQLSLAELDQERSQIREIGADLIGVLQKHPLLTELIDAGETA